MNKKTMIVGFVGIILIFMTYYLLRPMEHTPLMNQSMYRLQAVNVTPDNTSATLVDEGHGTIFIHPGVKKPTGAIFKFDKNGKVVLSFSIRKGSQVGDIAFTIIKNGKRVKQLIVTAWQKQPQRITIPVKMTDRLEVWADKHGSTAADWGNLELHQKEYDFKLKNFLIPFLWSLMFIYLLGKNHFYIGVNAYIGFVLVILAEKLNFGLLSFDQMLVYMLLLFSITFLFTLLYQELSFVKRYKVATILSYAAAIILYVVPLSFIVYALNYHVPVTNDVLVAVFQSNTHESMEYISDFISVKYIVLFVFITLFVGFLLYRQETKETAKIERSLLLFLIIVFFSIASVQFTSLRLPHFLIKGFSAYSFELDRFKELLAKRKTGTIQYKAVKKEQGETYIVIIGESLNKGHMGVYGYVRQTTPNLSKMYRNGELTRFNNVYSNHTHTVFVLDLALTEANQYNKKNFYDSLSIMDILKKAGVETYWLTNQPLYSIYDNMVSIIGTSADHVVALNTDMGGVSTGKPKYDGRLIREVKRVLENDSPKDRVLFVHLGGSHTTYSARYPNDTYTIFSKKPALGVFGKKASQVDTLNSYDNSVYYNDYVVSSILKLLQQDKSAMALVYMSDHADDVINKLGHNSAMFTYAMTQIPMLFWFSDTYQKRYPQHYHTLRKHTDTLFSNDLWYDTLIGLMNIKTDHYNPASDLSSPSYRLDPRDALVLHGKRHYTEKANTFYWQKANIRYLQKQQLTAKIVPLHVNTLAKYKEVRNSGISLYETDVYLMENPQMRFRLGTDVQWLGMTLEDFLHRTEGEKAGQMVLHLMNATPSNKEKAIQRLVLLDQQYRLKNTVTLVVSDAAYLSLAEKGWHVSYALPKEKMLSTSDREAVAQRIAKEVFAHKLESLTFDEKIYPWVKQYLEPLLPKKVHYNVWTSLRLYDNQLQSKLLYDKRLTDPRVHRLFCAFHSPFEL